MSPARVLLFSWVCLAASSSRAETPAERFGEARLQFDHKNFETAARMLQSLLYPTTALDREDDIAQAREMLGLSLFYLGREKEAAEEFRLLLYLRPRHRLDPFLVPPPAVRLFDSVREDPGMREKLGQLERERLERERREAERAKTPPRTLVRREYYEKTDVEHSRWLAFLPFGVGQFQNGHSVKGLLLLAGQGLALGTNLVSYLLMRVLSDENGYYTAAEIPVARGLRVSLYASLGVFAALYIYGAIDANWYFTSRSPGEPVLIREEQQEVPGVGLFPSLMPGGGGGLTLMGRF